ncbi:SWIM zinc finger family protein [Actinokineospora enzanensis]|uniref:SWIM zinc finger family protein n=1 Tax=Actinokineospora enzanensis TaxID=155975 RepID=UPI00036FE6D3|nr:SWIM zinc finger family protein [Actinokineospora enzanensis]
MTEDWWDDGPSVPIPVDGGLKARSQRGEIARTWWSRRFIATLEQLGLSGRLSSGKRYARAGQVVSMSLSTSIVVAQVQGTRPEPYRVRVGIRAFSATEWDEVERAFAGQALYLAKLLAGELPEDVEDVFEQAGLRLFPVSPRELTMDCSCPDWQVPCKHLAAICYLLAESFDADPFEFLAWRGRGRQELLDNLRRLRAHTAEPVDDGEPLADVLDTFWGAAVPAPTTHPARVAPDALLDQLVPPSLAVRGKPIVEWLRPAYRAMADEEEA